MAVSRAMACAKALRCIETWPNQGSERRPEGLGPRQGNEWNEARELGRSQILQVFKLCRHKDLLGELISRPALEPTLHRVSARAPALLPVSPSDAEAGSQKQTPQGVQM